MTDLVGPDVRAGLFVSSQNQNNLKQPDMKNQNNTTLTYIAPKVKTVAFSSRSHILQSSITDYQEGSHSDNNGEGIDME